MCSLCSLGTDVSGSVVKCSIYLVHIYTCNKANIICCKAKNNDLLSMFDFQFNQSAFVFPFWNFDKKNASPLSININVVSEPPLKSSTTTQ